MKAKIVRFLENIMVLLCTIIIAVSFFSLLYSTKDPDRILTIFGYRPAVIISGSMRPLLNPWDLIISKVVNPKDIKIGDIITYRVDGTIPNTHRVVNVINQDGDLKFETKGDANNSMDTGIVSANKIVSLFIFKVPRIGYISKVLKTKLAFSLVIVVPIILIGIFQLWTEFHKNMRFSQ